jgi:hypothetical protein
MDEEQKPCQWCGYYEDADAWHYEGCPVFDDPMFKTFASELKRLRERMNDMLHRLEMEERDAGHAEQELEYWIDTWKQWIKEMIE